MVIQRFQNGGSHPSRILKICSFSHVAFVGMPFCVLVQISLKFVDELWPKKAIFKMAAAAIF